MPEQIRYKTNAGKAHKVQPEPKSPDEDRSHPLLKIQKSLGNRALLRLRHHLGTIQTKLSLGQPHDIYEQEADAVASRIVNQISQTQQPSTAPGETSPSTHPLQRQEVPEEELQTRR
ncbi:MAG: hypothetical protein P1S60_20540, partial [Anaerolineae bacterium]|nr:hypothetical protein [Anaerolineae bacterium]